MYESIDEVRAIVDELPANAQEIWNQEFQKALLEVKGEVHQAAMMAWRAFKGKERRIKPGRRGEKAARGILLVAASGGTPEWIRLAENYGLVLDEFRCPCLVDRRALDAIVSGWERSDSNLVIYLEDHGVKEGLGLAVGWIREMKCRSDGLWIRVDWTARGLDYIRKEEFGYLSLEFSLDEWNRPVRLWRAKLTDCPVLEQWAQEVGIYAAPGQQAEKSRKLRLVREEDRLERGRAAKRGENPKQRDEDADQGSSETTQFLKDLKELLGLLGEISLREVKKAIIDLKIQH